MGIQWANRKRHGTWAMLMKVFPHGTGYGGKPTKYLMRGDYPGRDTAPHILRGDIALTIALIGIIDRRWKFTAGKLAWHLGKNVGWDKQASHYSAPETACRNARLWASNTFSPINDGTKFNTIYKIPA